MKLKDFRKTITFEWLAKTDEYVKFILKSRLKVPLRGNIWETCRLCFVGRVSEIEDMSSFIEVYKSTLKKGQKKIEEIFKEMIKNEFWETEDIDFEHYDENGKLVELNADDFESGPLTKEIKITTKTKYFIDENKINKIREIDIGGLHIYDNKRMKKEMQEELKRWKL